MDTVHHEQDVVQLAVNAGQVTQPIKRLSALDQLFDASGVAEIKVTRGQKEIVLQIPIQSIDNEVIEALAKPYRPRVPIKRMQIEGKWRDVINDQDPEYQDKLSEYNRTLSYLMIFHGMAIDICDEEGKVVWSADNTVRDLTEARRIAKKMGLVDNHVVSIMRAIRQLTASAEDMQIQE